MVQRTYYDDGGPEWEWWDRAEITLPEDRSGIHIRHGYRLADIDHLARLAMGRTFGFLGDRREQYETIYGAITLALFEAETPPDAQDLINAGQHANKMAFRRHQQAHGIPGDSRDRDVGLKHGNFVRYWSAAAGSTPSAEERILDRVALTQVWPHLADTEQAAVAAVALTGTRAGAAQALDIPARALDDRMRRARRRAFALWFDHETPPAVPVDRRVGNYRPPPAACKNGHPYRDGTFKDEYSAKTRTTSRRCLECKRAWAEENRDKRAADKKRNHQRRRARRGEAA